MLTGASLILTAVALESATASPSFQDTLANCSQQVMSVPAARSGVGVLGRFALFAVEDHNTSVNSGIVDIFDGHNKTWSVSNMSESRTNMCPTSWKHLAIFAGGSTGRHQPKSDHVDVYDTNTGKWSLHHLKMGRDLLACSSAGDYTIFAGGSAPQANQSETANVEAWNHVTGEWTILPQGLSQSRKKPEAVSVGPRIIVAGGEIAKSVAQGAYDPGCPACPLGSYTATMDILDTRTMTWELNSTMPQAMQYFGAARASGAATPGATDGVVVWAGGFYNDQVRVFFFF
jgi:hypothetical protein